MNSSLHTRLRGIQNLAAAIIAYDAQQPEIAHIALAACVRNRSLHSAEDQTIEAWCEAQPRVPTSVAFLESSRKMGDCAVSEAVFLRAFANICLLCCGDISDPTHGAIQFHRHNAWPHWACNRTPIALIGGYFFYTDADLLSVPLDLHNRLPSYSRYEKIPFDDSQAN